MRLSCLLALATGVSLASTNATALSAQTSCDPTEIASIIPLAAAEDVEVARSASGLYWINVNPDQFDGILDSRALDDDGVLRASAIHVTTQGRDCSAVVDAIRIKQGDTWRNLRLAGNNVFAPGYFNERIAVDTIQIGLKLFLLQKSYCDISVKALIYADQHPFLRPYPYPDPDC